ncbi:MAG: hypothetical protein M3393_00535 [Actinomycetota bacterium]|nr:hypothetical protein [Actinomycetota bacterium]
MNLLNWLVEGTSPVGDGVLRVPEVLGIVLLFMVFAGNEVRADFDPLWATS